MAYAIVLGTIKLRVRVSPSVLKERNDMNIYYKQCALKDPSGFQTIVWIPEQFAKKGKQLIVGDKKTGARWTVLRTFDNIKLTQEQIDVNRKSKFESINI